jgi:hypothetical protein
VPASRVLGDCRRLADNAGVNGPAFRSVRRMPAAAKVLIGLYLLNAAFVVVWGIRTGVGWWTVLLAALWVVSGVLWAWRISRSRER